MAKSKIKLIQAATECCDYYEDYSTWQNMAHNWNLCYIYPLIMLISLFPFQITKYIIMLMIYLYKN